MVRLLSPVGGGLFVALLGVFGVAYRRRRNGGDNKNTRAGARGGSRAHKGKGKPHKLSDGGGDGLKSGGSSSAGGGSSTFVEARDNVALQLTPALKPRTAQIKLATDVVMGCSTLAGMFTALPEGDAVKTVEAALLAGIKTFDTAPHYGLGLSEERLGRALAMLSTIAKLTPGKVQVWTKVGRVIYDSSRGETAPKDADVEHGNMAGNPGCIFPETSKTRTPVLDYTADGVRRSFHDSQRRLRLEPDNLSGKVSGRNSPGLVERNVLLTDSGIVGVRVHDAETEERFAAAMKPGSGAVDGMVQLRKEGLLTNVSIGMNDASYVLRMIEGKPTGTFNSVMLAGSWNLLDQSGLGVLKACDARNIEVHNAGVFASGLLVGGSTYRYSKAPPEMVAKTERWGKLAAKFAVPLPAVALHFAFAPAVVSKVAVGLKTPAEVESTKRWLSTAIPAALWSEAKTAGLLDAACPTPGSIHAR